MKNKNIYLLIILIIGFSGCSKFLDINHDPNNPENSTVEYVFPAGVENTAYVFGGYWLNLGEIWSQHWTSAANAPQYQAEDSYNVTAGDYAYDIRGWQSLYTGCLEDYQWVKEKASEDGDWAYYLMAEVMQAYTYQVLDDFFDQIPLSDALQQVPAHFDNGKDVYDTLIARIDYALSQDYNSGKIPSDDDLVFHGSMNDWVAFANTLKLKIYLRQRFVRPDVAEAGVRSLYNSGAQFLNKDAGFDNFADESGRDNYIYGIEFRGGNINMKASRTTISFLDDNNDPRLDTLFKKPDNGTHAGMLQGDFRNVYSNIDEKKDLSSPYVYALQPVFFISKAESYFLQAEACMLGWGTGDAKSLYETAIDAHLERLGLDLSLASDIYGSGKYAEYPVSGTEEEKLEKIIVQKWVSMINTQGMESFFEHNRTGYPRESSILPGDSNFPDGVTPGEFTVSVTSVLAPPVLFPKRLMFPSSEQSKNPNVPAVESLNTPVWWDRSNQ